MYFIVKSILVWVTIFIAISKINGQRRYSSLRGVYVIFRHGDRFPYIDDEMFPIQPFESQFESSNSGQLTNEGKRRMYNFGKFLRKRYDNFLGPDYNPLSLYAHSTDYDRTMQSLQLTLASLFAPNVTDNLNKNLYWQPVPFLYENQEEGELLLGFPQCLDFIDEYNKVIESWEVHETLARFRPYLDDLAKSAGRSVPMSSMDVRTLMSNLNIAKFMNFPLKPWGADALCDGKLAQIAQYFLSLRTYNDKLKRYFAGSLRHMIDNIKQLIATPSKMDHGRIHLYSGHDLNIVAIQTIVGVFKKHFPQFSSAVIFELHFIQNKYYILLLYYLGIPAKLHELTIPGCETLCPIENFLNLTATILPSDEEISCKERDLSFKY